MATYRKPKESFGFKVIPQIIKTNFDERKLEEKGGTKTLLRPIGPLKRFVNLGTHRNTKQKVFTRSIENNHTKKEKLKIRKRVTKGARKSGRSVRN